MIPYYTLELSNDPGPIGFNNGTPINPVVTLDLQDGARYAVDSIDLKIAPRRGGALGNGPYQEVQGTITLAVLGSTPTNCVVNYEILLEVLQDSGRWWDGQFLNPTYLNVQVSNISAMWRSLIYVPRGTEYANTPPEQVVPNGPWVIPGITINFIRRGLWLNDVQMSASSGAAVATPAVMRCAGLPDQIIPAPTEVQLTAGSNPFSVSSPNVTYVAVASNPDASLSLPDDIRIGIVQAESGTGPTGSTNVADAGNFASGTVRRVSIPPTANGDSGLWTLSGYSRSIRAVSIWAAIRNNSTTGIWTLKTFIGSVGDARTVSTVIDNTPNTPLMYNLGYFPLTNTFSSWGVQFNVAGAVGTPTLDIDYFVITPAEEDGCTVYQLNDYTVSGPLISTDPRPLTGVNPAVLWGAAANNLIFPIGHSGDVSTHTYSNVVDVCVFGTNGTAWRTLNSTLTGAQTFSATALRRMASLLPG